MVYLLHFDRPYRAKTGKRMKEAGHYIGFTWNLQERIKEHASGQGARLLEVISEDGIGFSVARVWEGGDRKLERRLKRRKKARLICPCCRQDLSHLRYSG